MPTGEVGLLKVCDPIPLLDRLVAFSIVRPTISHVALFSLSLFSVLLAG